MLHLIARLRASVLEGVEAGDHEVKAEILGACGLLASEQGSTPGPENKEDLEGDAKFLR